MFCSRMCDSDDTRYVTLAGLSDIEHLHHVYAGTVSCSMATVSVFEAACRTIHRKHRVYRTDRKVMGRANTLKTQDPPR